MNNDAMIGARGQIPDVARVSEEERAQMQRDLQEQNPDAVVYLERRAGGAIRVWMAVPEHGLSVSSGDDQP